MIEAKELTKAFGDKLLIEPNLPKEQGANFVLMSAFLRGATNPPPKDWIDSGKWEVELAWKRYPARVQFQSFYDPKGERIKA